MTQFLEHLAEAKKGSTFALYNLVKLFEHHVFTLCFRIIRNREDAEEAAQDTFLNCFRNLRKLEEPEKFPQWLLRIAYNRSLDVVRKKKIMSLPLDEISDIPGDINTRVNKGDLGHSDYLELALKTLDPGDRALINLYYQENYAVKEIAEIVNISESNVKIRLYRARNEIRKVLESNNTFTKDDKGDKHTDISNLDY